MPFPPEIPTELPQPETVDLLPIEAEIEPILVSPDLEVDEDLPESVGARMSVEPDERNPGEDESDLQPEAGVYPEIEPLQIEIETEPGSVPLPHLLESLLFVAEEPVEPVKLAQALQRPLEAIEAALEELRRTYEVQNRGLRIQKRAGRLQLVTNPAAADAVEDFLNLDLNSRLSKPALESLAIVAYRQPVTRAQIEAVRGVDCSGVLRKLQQLGLIEELGRLEVVGRPILYGVTDLFLQHFGLTSLEELPELPPSEADSLAVTVALAEE